MWTQCGQQAGRTSSSPFRHSLPRTSTPSSSGCCTSFWESRGGGLCGGASTAGRVHAAPMPAHHPAWSHPGAIARTRRKHAAHNVQREGSRSPRGRRPQRVPPSPSRSPPPLTAREGAGAAHGADGVLRADLAAPVRCADAAALDKASCTSLRRRHNQPGDACTSCTHCCAATLLAAAAVRSASGGWWRRQAGAAATALARRPPRLRSRRRGLPAAGHPGGDGQRRRAAAPAGEPRAR